jgi:hypothetical protein
MNPDKPFDYLEGRLSPKERAALEERLMSDKQLQREFAVARQIHSSATERLYSQKLEADKIVCVTFASESSRNSSSVNGASSLP